MYYYFITIIQFLIQFNVYLLICRFKKEVPIIKPAQDTNRTQNRINTQKQNTKNTKQKKYCRKKAIQKKVLGQKP